MADVLKNRITFHEESLAFNQNGKYIFNDFRKVIAARAKEGNYAIIVGNSGLNTLLILYSHEGTSWTRITSQPTFIIQYWTID